MQLRSGRSIQKNKPINSGNVLQVKNKNMVLRSGRIITSIPKQETIKITSEQLKRLILNRLNVVLEIQNGSRDNLIYYIEMARGIIELYSFLNDNSNLIAKTFNNQLLKGLSQVIIEKAREFMSNETLNIICKNMNGHPDGKLIKNCMFELNNAVCIYSRFV